MYSPSREHNNIKKIYLHKVSKHQKYKKRHCNTNKKKMEPDYVTRTVKLTQLREHLAFVTDTE